MPACNLRKSFQLQTLYRENDQQRAEAIAKWRQWRADAIRTRREPPQVEIVAFRESRIDALPGRLFRAALGGV